MSENCTHDCSTCSAGCAERNTMPEKFKLNEMSAVRRLIAVASGKGGVGKSLVTAMMAVLLNRRGYNTAILDADLTGPSIPKAFGLSKNLESNGEMIFPAQSKTGIQIVSVNLLLENPRDPVVWRGPVLGGVIGQFWRDVAWNNVDFMFVDMPPGTGDVPLTVYQSLPVDGLITVTSPQGLVSMVVDKAVRMAELLDIPMLGIVENMSYVPCPDCGKEIHIFGESHIDEVARQHELPLLGKLPLDTKLAAAVDAGMIELFDGDWLDKAADAVEAMVLGEE